jgi:hypothetical protein
MQYEICPLRILPGPQVIFLSVILLAPMENKIEDEGSMGRMQRFAEIYREKMKARPYMELIARYDAMTEAGLLVGERVKADLYLDTHRMNELLYPEKLSIVAKES